MIRQMLIEQIEIVERVDDPINVFRDLAAHQMISLPTENYGGFGDYDTGAFSNYDTGHYGYVDQIESLFQQAKQKALEKR